LPSATSFPRAGRTDDRAGARTSGSGGNWILFIEDRPDDSELYAERLQAVGLNVITAPTGAQGLAKAVALQPSVVVLDLMLPDVDGWAVCEQLRNEPRTCEIPVVILTARFESGLRQRAHDLGCAGYLTKPCDVPTLTSEIRRILGTA
jgi:CheY-like chemotaxis protein